MSCGCEPEDLTCVSRLASKPSRTGLTARHVSAAAVLFSCCRHPTQDPLESENGTKISAALPYLITQASMDCVRVFRFCRPRIVTHSTSRGRPTTASEMAAQDGTFPIVKAIEEKLRSKLRIEHLVRLTNPLSGALLGFLGQGPPNRLSHA